LSACLPCQPACLVSLPALSACLLRQPACLVSQPASSTCLPHQPACLVSLPTLSPCLPCQTACFILWLLLALVMKVDFCKIIWLEQSPFLRYLWPRTQSYNFIFDKFMPKIKVKHQYVFKVMPI
jgi:hypothetical protein